MRYFVSIAKHRSFTKAAEQLKIAQPALGLQIRKLEDELGQQLLHRHSRGVEVTEAGAVFLMHAERMLKELEAAQRAMMDLSGEPRGPAAVGMLPNLINSLSSPLVQRCRREHPQIFLSMVEEFSAVIVEMVGDGRLDIGCAYEAGEAPGLGVIPLMREKMFLIGAGDGRPGSYGSAEPIAFAALCELPLMLPAWPLRQRTMLDQQAESLGLRLRIEIEVQAQGLAKALAAKGVGYAVLPYSFVEEEVARGTLSARPIADPEVLSEMNLVYREDRPLSKAAKAVSDLIRQIVAERIATPGTGWYAAG